MVGPYRIVLADGHALFRQELKKLIQPTPGLEVVGEVEDSNALAQLLAQARPDLVIIDISLPHIRAMQATRLIKDNNPTVKVLILVMDHDEEYFLYARRAGADGVLLKQYTAVELLRAIKDVRAGKFYLPPQLREKKSYEVATGRTWGGNLIEEATSR